MGVNAETEKPGMQVSGFGAVTDRIAEMFVLLVIYACSKVGKDPSRRVFQYSPGESLDPA